MGPQRGKGKQQDGVHYLGISPHKLSTPHNHRRPSVELKTFVTGVYYCRAPDHQRNMSLHLVVHCPLVHMSCSTKHTLEWWENVYL